MSDDVIVVWKLLNGIGTELTLNIYKFGCLNEHCTGNLDKLGVVVGECLHDLFTGCIMELLGVY